MDSKDPSGLTLSGTNTTWLKFANSGSLGTDSSGQGNTWTIGSAITAHDQMVDSPTFGSSSTGNCCTLNPLTEQSGLTITEGNLKMSRSSAGNVAIPATMGASTGKYYLKYIGIMTHKLEIMLGVLLSQKVHYLVMILL